MNAVAASPDPRDIAAQWKDEPQLSGSRSGEFTFILLHQALKAVFRDKAADPRLVEVHQEAALAAFTDIAPRNPP
jgi:hypothetical protein